MKKDIQLPNTRLFNLYFHELAWLCGGIKNDCEEIFKATALASKSYFVKIDPDLHARIQVILANAASLKTLIITTHKKDTAESFEVYKLRQERSKILQEVLDGVEIIELFSNHIRLCSERQAEYFDEANVDLSRPGQQAGCMAAYLMTFSHWEAFGARVVPIRLYIASERKFYTRRAAVDLGRVSSEACAILDRIEELGLIEAGTQPGLMVRL